jgi:uncharacterized protein YbaR (Trm112 family)
MFVINEEFLAMLRCPVDRQKVAMADDDLVKSINAAITAGSLRNKGGNAVSKQVDGALVREDKQLAYPIFDGIPVMLADEAIALDQVAK